MNKSLSQEEIFLNLLKDYEPTSDTTTKKVVSGNLKFPTPITPVLISKIIFKGLTGRYSMNNGADGAFTIEEDELMFYYKRKQGIKGKEEIEYHDIIPYDSIQSVKMGRIIIGLKALKIKGIHQGDKYCISILVNESKSRFPNQEQNVERLKGVLNQKGFEI